LSTGAGKKSVSEDDRRRDEILLRMLKTPPKPKSAVKAKSEAKRTTGKGRARLGKARS
jgi:hypothetical protein